MLEFEGRGKIKSISHRALHFHAFCMLISLAVVWVSPWVQRRASFQISAGSSPPPPRVCSMTQNVQVCYQAEEETELPLLCPGRVL